MAVFRIRIICMILFMALGCSALLLRIFYLHVIDGNNLAVEGLSSRIQEFPVTVSRGEIFDCNLIPLTNDSQQYALLFFPGQISDWHDIYLKLHRVVELPEDFTIKTNRRTPFRLAKTISSKTAEEIRNLCLPGVVVVKETLRYNEEGLAAHVLGYINTADNQGVAGIEKICDSVLRSNNSLYIAAFVDAGNQLIPGLGYKKVRFDAKPQQMNVVLTINNRIQKIVESVMDEDVKKGAVVVLDPYTGEVLAMTSRPKFNANELSKFLMIPTAPLINRSLTSFQPGSVFKLVVACAALEEDVVEPLSKFNDRGYIDVNNIRFKGWDYDQGGRGILTFEQALAYSSNPVFIQVGLSLGAERLIRFAHKAGFGQQTALNFPNESAGILPNPSSIYAGDLANISIGQGNIEATPLQVGVFVSSIVNNGVLIRPNIIKSIIDQNYNVIKSQTILKPERVMSAKTAGILRKMMIAATTYGTGKNAYVPGFGSAGKTGSAETGRRLQGGRGINHAWFAGYGPIIDPKYVIVVFIEDGMSGGEAAAPVFRKIMHQILLAK